MLKLCVFQLAIKAPVQLCNIIIISVPYNVLIREISCGADIQMILYTVFAMFTDFKIGCMAARKSETPHVIHNGKI